MMLTKRAQEKPGRYGDELRQRGRRELNTASAQLLTYVSA
jgi:hypothetical protein